MAEPDQKPVSEPEVLDTGDAASVKKVIREAKTAAMRDKEWLTSSMSTLEGRRWYWNFLVGCHVYHDPFSRDPLITAHNCGEANIGRQLLAALENASPSLYLSMIKENRPNG